MHVSASGLLEVDDRHAGRIVSDDDIVRIQIAVKDATVVGALPAGCEQRRARRGKRQLADDVPSVLLPGVEVACGAGPQGRFGCGRRARSGEIPIQIAPRDIAFCAKQSRAVPGVAHRSEDPAQDELQLLRISALQTVRQRIDPGPTGTADERIAKTRVSARPTEPEQIGPAAGGKGPAHEFIVVRFFTYAFHARRNFHDDRRAFGLAVGAEERREFEHACRTPPAVEGLQGGRAERQVRDGGAGRNRESPDEGQRFLMLAGCPERRAA